MNFSRLLLIVAAALSLSACFHTAEEIAADDDAACRSAGLKPGTPAYDKCRDDKVHMRSAMGELERSQQRMIWNMQRANQLQQMNRM
jgi:hypothetical protein